jgi:ribose/xylose/arabinose/galactoside ABC-type transport system permease subunit
MLQQVMVVGTIAIGQTLIILTAGIDLSCGMVMALGSIVMTKFAADYGLSAPVRHCPAALPPRRFGLLNGLLVTRQVATVHRDLGHLEYCLCHHPTVFPGTNHYQYVPTA